MKKFLSILFCLSITLFIYSQEVTVSGGHSVQENKTTKVILNAVNGSVEIHKHVLDGTSFGYGSGSAWDDDLGYISTRTTTTINSSTTEYLCNTPAELTVDKPVKLSIGGNDAWSFTINPTGGTQYWDVKPYNPTKYLLGIGVLIASIFSVSYTAYDIYHGLNDNYVPVWGLVSGVCGIGMFTSGIVMINNSLTKITLVKIDY